MLFRSPGAMRPRTYSGAQTRRTLCLKIASKGATQRSNFASQRSFVADTRAVTLTYEALR